MEDINLSELWEYVDESVQITIGEAICFTCENKQACDNCEFTFDKVVHRSHYYNSKDLV